MNKEKTWDTFPHLHMADYVDFYYPYLLSLIPKLEGQTVRKEEPDFLLPSLLQAASIEVYACIEGKRI